MPYKECLKGYSGFLCASCEKGYANSKPIGEMPVCLSCPSKILIILAIIGAILFGSIVISPLIYMKLNKGNKYLKELYSDGTNKNPKLKRSVLSVVQRMVLSHMQVLSVIGEFDFKWPVLYIYI
jgi:hypothetical protein